jgi:hypothetical protein
VFVQLRVDASANDLPSVVYSMERHVSFWAIQRRRERARVLEIDEAVSARGIVEVTNYLAAVIDGLRWRLGNIKGILAPAGTGGPTRGHATENLQRVKKISGGKKGRGQAPPVNSVLI